MSDRSPEILALALELTRYEQLSSSQLCKRPRALEAIMAALSSTEPALHTRAQPLVGKLVQFHRLRPRHVAGGLSDAAATSLLVALRAGATSEVRALAAEALREAEVVRARPALIAQLADDSEEVRSACVSALARARFTNADMRVVGTLLFDDRPEVRAAALRAIPAHVERSALSGLGDPLRAALSDEQRSVRMGAAELLYRAGVAPAESVPLCAALAEAAVHGAPPLRVFALRGLADAGSVGARHCVAVTACTRAQRADIRAQAVHALTRIPAADESAESIIATVLERLSDTHREPRDAAVRGLARLYGDGRYASRVARATLAVLSDLRAPTVARRGAAQALGAMRARIAMIALIEAAASGDADLAGAAVRALQDFRPDDLAALDAPEDARVALVEALASAMARADQSGDLTIDACAAAVALDVEVTRAPEALRRIMAGSDPWRAAVAEELLRTLADPARDAQRDSDR